MSDEIPFPIPREEARLDVAHARKSIARLERKKAALMARAAEVDEKMVGVQRMLRTIFAYYPELADEAPPAQKPLADLFGSDPDFTGGQDSVAFVREGRGDVPEVKAVCGRCGQPATTIAGYYLGVPVCAACDEQQGWPQAVSGEEH